MPLPDHVLEELGRRRLAEQREAERIRHRDFARTIVQCFFWMTVGLAMIAWALHTTDEQLGSMSFYAGILIGNGGICWTLASAYVRGERRGDW